MISLCSLYPLGVLLMNDRRLSFTENPKNIIRNSIRVEFFDIYIRVINKKAPTVVENLGAFEIKFKGASSGEVGLI